MRWRLRPFIRRREVVPRRAPSAMVDPTAFVPEDCDIGPNVVIERGVRLGRRCRIGANTVIAAGVEIGDDCRIARQCDAQPLPDRRPASCCIPGCRIGQDGFGFAPDPKAPIKVPQLGRVIIGDDVDIGANTTIDRGSGHER